MFNLFILDNFGLFSFGFRLRVHLDVNIKIWGSETAAELVLIDILRDSLDIQGTVS